MDNNIVELSIPQPSQVAVTDAETMLAAAQQFQITNAEQSVELQQTRQRINTRIKGLNAERLEITRPIDAAKQKVMAFFAPPMMALDNALKVCDGQIIAWQGKVEAERREAQRKADADAERERQRLQSIADAAAAKGNESKQQRFEERAAAVVAPVMVAAPAQAPGVSLRENWVFEILDASKIDRAYSCPDEVKIGKLVKALKGEAQALLGPGVRVYNAPIVASRRVAS